MSDCTISSIDIVAAEKGRQHAKTMDDLMLDYVKFISRVEATSKNKDSKEHRKRLSERLASYLGDKSLYP